MFDWGDGTDSGWIGTYNSGVDCYATHHWTKQGSKIVRVKAKDVNGKESDWSDPLIVTMPKNKAINTPFLRFLENHPRMFPMLRQLFELQ